MSTSNFQSQLKNYIYTNSSIDNIGFYFHTYTESYKRFSKNGTGSYEITKDKLATAMKKDLSIVTDNIETVEDFFGYNRNQLASLVDPKLIIDKIVNEKFDQIIRNN